MCPIFTVYLQQDKGIEQQHGTRTARHCNKNDSKPAISTSGTGYKLRISSHGRERLYEATESSLWCQYGDLT